jgi:SAM-dependent methyltransferase
MKPPQAHDSSQPIDDEGLEAEYTRYDASPRKRQAWSSTNAGNRAARSELRRALRALAGPQLAGDGAILDVGCGTGGWLKELGSEISPTRLYGVDAVESRLDSAARAIPDAHFEHADARALPFEDGRFVLVLLFTILLDMRSSSDIAAVLSECDRVLAPGGLLTIYEPRMPNPFNRTTRTIRQRDISLPTESLTLTLLPPLARRLGRLTPVLYPRLVAIPPLRTHRLWWYRKPALNERLE